MRTRNLATFLAFFASLALAGDKGFNPPPATHAKTYPLVETHDDEKVSVAVDLYDRPPKSAVFHINYREHGFLPLRLIVSNDGAKPLMLDSLKVEYITGHRDKIQPATSDDISRRMRHPRPLERNRAPIPVPIPRKSPASGNKDALEELQSASFLAVPVTPGSTHSGFLFFDVLDVDDPKSGAHLYVSGIKAGTQELFYFDIPLNEEATAPPTPTTTPH